MNDFDDSPENAPFADCAPLAPAVEPPTPLDLLKEQILNDFSDWLDGLSAEELTAEAEPATEVPDLQSFYGELCAVRRDVQLQAKGNQGIHREIKELLTTLERASGEQAEESDRRQESQAAVKAARCEGRAELAEDLIELAEATQRLAAAPLPSLPVLAIGARRRRMQQELREGAAVLSRRAEALLRRRRIEPVAKVGDPFDPAAMRAVGSASGAGAPGSVTEICRQGYRLAGSIIHPAEVKVEQS